MRQTFGMPSDQFPQAITALRQVFLLQATRFVVSDCQCQRVETIQDNGGCERQFLERGLRAMQHHIPHRIPPHDSFSVTAFDVVIHRHRTLGKGGFGEVFEGSWRGTKVAIKLISKLYPPVSGSDILLL